MLLSSRTRSVMMIMAEQWQWNPRGKEVCSWRSTCMVFPLVVKSISILIIAMRSYHSPWTSSLEVFLQVNLPSWLWILIASKKVHKMFLLLLKSKLFVIIVFLLSSKRIIWRRRETYHWIIGWEWRIYSYLWGQWRRQDACGRCPMAVRIFKSLFLCDLISKKLIFFFFLPF